MNELNSHNGNKVIDDNKFMILVVLLLNKFVFAIAEHVTSQKMIASCSLGFDDYT